MMRDVEQSARATLPYEIVPMSYRPELLVVGNVCMDRVKQGRVLGERLGGAAAYAAEVASRADVCTAVVTAAPAQFAPLAGIRAYPGIRMQNKPCDGVTVFEVVWPEDGQERRERVLCQSPILAAHDIPDAWRHAPVAYVAPILGECPGALVTALHSPLIAVGAQGWLRKLSPEGWVEEHESAEFKTPPANVGMMIFSHTDHPEAEWQAKRLAKRGIWVVVTRGAEGGSIYRPRQRVLHYAAVPAVECDPTGAGDTFGTVFTVAIGRGHKAGPAARLAATAAARVVEGPLLGNLQSVIFGHPRARQPRAQIQVL